MHSDHISKCYRFFCVFKFLWIRMSNSALRFNTRGRVLLPLLVGRAKSSPGLDVC
uniref:Uncharacterized protein n=1 Tax=Anguilla anguilla TaxID=7936 RepID=A0A0E9U016_ANGAN